MQTYRFRSASSHSVVMSLEKEITDNSLLKLTTFISSHSVVMLSEKEITDNSLLKLTAVNFDHNALKLFFYVEISVNKISHLDVSISIKRVKTFLYIEILKRRQKSNDTDFNEFIIKILKVMLTLTAFTVNDENNKYSVKTDISTSLIYAEAVRDSI